MVTAEKLAVAQTVPATRAVLVVDDDAAVRALTQRVLTESGLACDLAGGGRRGLELAAATPYDLILLDIALPDMGGDAVLRRIRNASRARHQKVVVFSGN